LRGGAKLVFGATAGRLRLAIAVKFIFDVERHEKG
jgi:hypothetical protein